jgi:hypothetical protein
MLAQQAQLQADETAGRRPVNEAAVQVLQGISFFLFLVVFFIAV